ncbi:MAG: HAD family hydrolase [Thermodesulfovibrionales bacterium]|nr:HAD family hydrolase [Thermodesulfovibrionales bacterium]
MIKAVIFDLYGTLIDIRTDEKSPEVYWHLSRYLTYHGVKVTPERLQESYFEGINKSLANSKEVNAEINVYEIFNEIMNRFGCKLYNEQTVIDVCMLFRSLTIRNFSLFNDVIETLSYLQSNYLIALISDAQWVFTEPELMILNLDRFFPVRFLSSKYGYKKPDKRLFEKALKKLDVRAKDAVYIGDNPQRDLVGAKNANIKCILFRNDTTKYNGYEADGVFYNYTELKYLIEQL